MWTITSFALLLAAFALAFGRMIRDSKREHRLLALDRIVALDMMAGLSIGLITLYAVFNEKPIFLDAAMMLALLAFLGTTAFARYLEKGKK